MTWLNTTNSTPETSSRFVELPITEECGVLHHLLGIETLESKSFLNPQDQEHLDFNHSDLERSVLNGITYLVVTTNCTTVKMEMTTTNFKTLVLLMNTQDSLLVQFTTTRYLLPTLVEQLCLFLED